MMWDVRGIGWKGVAKTINIISTSRRHKEGGKSHTFPFPLKEVSSRWNWHTFNQVKVTDGQRIQTNVVFSLSHIFLLLKIYGVTQDIHTKEETTQLLVL